MILGWTVKDTNKTIPSNIYLAHLQYAKIEENHMTLWNEKIQQIIACYLADAKRKLHRTLL